MYYNIWLFLLFSCFQMSTGVWIEVTETWLISDHVGFWGGGSHYLLFNLLLIFWWLLLVFLSHLLKELKEAASIWLASPLNHIGANTYWQCSTFFFFKSKVYCQWWMYLFLILFSHLLKISLCVRQGVFRVLILSLKMTTKQIPHGCRREECMWSHEVFLF